MNPVAAAFPKLASPLALLELSEIAVAPLRYGHAVRVLRDGALAFPAMLAGIRAAKRTVCFENFIMADDQTGREFAAGLRKVIRDLIVGGYVDVLVSTGAILYQDIYQARGYRHYRGTPAADDKLLRDLRIDRIYDTYVDEERFLATDHWCGVLADQLAPGVYSSRAYVDFIGANARSRAEAV